MKKQPNFVRLGVVAGNATITASLCAVLIAGPIFAEEPGTKPTPKTAASPSLTDQQKTLHALNRLTFGPHPGDVATVQKLGLHAWFEQQLNPSKIDDSQFDGMLAEFPSLKLSPDQLVRKFPGPQMLKAISVREMALPSDPAEHAIYAAALAGYADKKGADIADLAAAKKSSKQAVRRGENPPAAAMQADGTPQMSASNDMGDGQSMALSSSATDTESKRDQRRARREPFEGNVVELAALPPNERMAQIYAMDGQQLVALKQTLGGGRMIALMRGLSPEQKETLSAIVIGPIRVVGAEALQARILRDVYSDRQLQAVMTDFWLNHFSVYARKNQNEPYLLSSYERDTVLPNSLGKFEDLLIATAKSPAMLIYLDNWQSVGPDSPAAQRGKRFQRFADSNPNRPGVAQVAQLTPKGINENYAREIIELHTLGVKCEVSADRSAQEVPAYCGRGYTQADVTNLAKVLTGWTVDRPYRGGMKYTFDENRHEGGTKQVLGMTISGGGEREGLQVLHALATSPGTAHFISHKLLVRFVSDTPPQEMEDAMAATFLKTGGDVKAVLRTMFDSPAFWSPDVYRAKVKTPIEFVASALRASDAKVNNSLALIQAMDRLGMPIYGMQTPNGYSWAKDEWVSTNALVSRMNFALVLSGGLMPGIRLDWAKLVGDGANAAPGSVPSPATEERLEAILLGQPAAAHTRSTVLEQSARPGQAQEAVKGLALASATPSVDDDEDMMMPAGKKGVFAKKGAGNKSGYGGAGLSMTALASNAANDGPVPTMAGLLLGSPEFQRR